MNIAHDPTEFVERPDAPWFVERMMHDEWHFGLLLKSGQVLAIKHIKNFRVAAGEFWVDVCMLPVDDMWVEMHKRDLGWNFIAAPTSRDTASVRVAEIVAAFELADT